MKFSRVLKYIIVLLFISCNDPSDQYAGWTYYENTSSRFSLYYLSPPWEACPDTRYPQECHGLSGSTSFWIPPLVLLPEYLIIPPYKFEILPVSYNADTLSLATSDKNTIVSSGRQLLVDVREITNFQGDIGHEFVYYDIIDRDDPRYYRVVYFSNAASAVTLKVVLDSSVEYDSEESDDIIKSVGFLTN